MINFILIFLLQDCIECMALSDNTIRAGLTPKFKDVSTLCESLTYRMYDPPIFQPMALPEGAQEYAPPVEEFAVHKIGVRFYILHRNFLSLFYRKTWPPFNP
jgi:mannose-6-phosphate isomerase